MKYTKTNVFSPNAKKCEIEWWTRGGSRISIDRFTSKRAPKAQAPRELRRDSRRETNDFQAVKLCLQNVFMTHVYFRVIGKKK